MECGIPVGLGTDSSCPLVTPYNMWRAVFWFAQHCGVSRAFALHTATLKNARILGIDNLTGSVEEGKSADLLALEKNPLEDLRALQQPFLVAYRGNLIRKPQVRRNAQIEAELDSLM